MSTVTRAPMMTLERAARLAGGELVGAAGAPRETLLGGASIDTRELVAGDLFVPLPGSRRDGHQFLGEAFARGAAAALCARDREAGARGAGLGPLIAVDDVTAALQRLAHGHRRGWSGWLLGITGSSGKTTTKDLVAAALAVGGPLLKTEGNLNNHWGVPLTLLRLRAEHRRAVVEMGSNHPGEIAMLAALAAPAAAVITNAGRAHLEFFGSPEAVAREKASLGFALERGAPLFAGADSPALLRALRGVGARLVTYGLAATADLRPRALADLGAEGTRIEVAGFPPFRLALVGRHQVMNALAALAVARELELDPAAVVEALSAHRATHGRMELKRLRGAMVLVDCYNSNPDSARAALDTLADWGGATRRIAVLGDMLELGPEAAALHRATGAAVRAAELWAIGEHAADYAAGARQAGVPVRPFEDLESLSAALREALAPGTVALIKASRGAALERALEGLEREED